jgi:hypothetical protein
MYLFLVVLWRFGGHSRFGGFHSRFGLLEFPVCALWELAAKPLICLDLVGAKRPESTKFPVFGGKSREFCSAGETGADLRRYSSRAP